MSNSKIPFLNLSAQNREVRDPLIKAFEEILDSGIYISNTNVSAFEESFNSTQKVPHTVACNSGTAALMLALQSIGVAPGDEIMVPGMTFIATIEAVVAVGATPVIIDVDSDSWNIDTEMARRKISTKTKAMIFVHLHGNPLGIIEAKNFCNENGLILVEDAAQAHLAEVDGVTVGNFGAVAAFSFYPGKNLGALGEGGCLSTTDATIYEKAMLIRNWGSREKYVHEIRGSNYRMDELQAAFLKIKLKELNKWTIRREGLAKNYDDFFDSVNIQRPSTRPCIRHTYHIYSILMDNRDDLRNYLSENSIESGIHYPSPINKMKPWIKYFANYSPTPVSEKFSRNCISLPLSDQHTENQIFKVIDVVDKFLAKN